MSFAPQQDWDYVEARSQPSELCRLREMTPSEKFAVYADLYNMLRNAKQQVSGDWELLEQLRWEEKLALRSRMVDAFRKLDELQRG